MAKVERIINLGSSSDGNSFYIELISDANQKPFNLLIECGFEYKELLRRLVKNNIDITDIDAVLVSHKHKDHSASLKELVSRGFTVFAPKSTFDNHSVQVEGNSKIHVVEEYKTFTMSKGINVYPIPLEHHDVNEHIENFGYIINIGDDFNILFAIDTKYLPQDLSDYTFKMIFIEANYIENNIRFALYDAIKQKDKGKISRYKRLYNSHFSLENLARTLDGTINENAKPFNLSQTDIVYLMHLSSNRTTNEKYYTTFLKKFIDSTREKTSAKNSIRVVAMKKEGGFQL